MARKKPSVQTLLKTDRAFAEMAQTYANLPPEGRNALIQCSHHIKRIAAEMGSRIEEKYRKQYANLQRKENNDDHD